MVKCAICNKRLESGTGPMFHVPRDDNKRLLWGSHCRMQFRPCDMVCKNHFPPEVIACCGKQYRLLPIAIPHPPPLSTASSNCLPYIQQTGMDSGHAQLGPDIGFSKSHATPIYDSGMIMSSLDSDAKLFSSSAVTTAQTQTTGVSVNDTQTQTNSKIFNSLMERQMLNLKKEMKILQDENKDLRRKLDESNAVVNNLKRIFSEGQIRKLILPDKNIKWSWKDISNAVCLHAAGPRAYTHLYEKGLPIPHVSTLQRWYRKTDISEGLLTASIDSMQHMSELCDDDKICVLAFDEMKVQEAFEYDQPGDYVRKPANYVQVVMARGLRKSWKQPVFYDFDCQMTKEILFLIILELKNANIPVVALVCDMGPTNRKLWKELNVTIDKPWFTHPADESLKVFVFADAPHLLKLIRNHYLDSGLVWNGQILTSRTICDVLKYTSKSDVSIAFKISEEHLEVKGIGRQKVKPAAQLLSNTTANAIRRVHSLGFDVFMPAETADFIQLVNDWFDVFNSDINTFGYPGKEPFGTALPEQLEVLTRMNEFMSQPIIPNKKGLEIFQRGILMSNRALVELYNYTKEKFNMHYILTNRLNQDVVEHFFGAIRSKGGLNDHPTPKEFQYRIRKYILGITNISYLSYHSLYHYTLLARNTELLKGTGNVSADNTEWLGSEKAPNFSTVASCSKENDPNVDNGAKTIMLTEEVEPHVIMELDTSHPDDCGILQEDALEYISGYILKKLDLKEHLSTDASFTWVDQVSKGFLHKPSPSFLQGVKELEKIFYSINALEIAHCKKLHQQMVSRSSEVSIPESAKRLFFKCRIHFRIRNLNKRLKIKKAKQKIMGYKKFIKINL